jgi:adenine-specific DNA-methyltransferase
MATGTPSTKRNSGLGNVGVNLPVELVYPNKRTAREILSHIPGDYKALFPKGSNNRLYFGENFDTLAALARDPCVRGHVRLIYIDPPYATQTVFHSRTLTKAYEDVFETSEYLEFLRERLIFLHSILASDGSIYLHIDDKMLFHAKLILDEVFGPDNYRNCITRKKCNPKNYTRKAYGNVSDYILFYTKSDSYVWNRQVEPWTEERAKEYQYIDETTGRRHMRVPVHAPGTRNGETGKAWRGKLPPPGKHWQFTPATLDELDAKGEIHWSKNGNPRRKVFLDTSDGISVQDIWTDFKDAHNQNICITGYPTEKNFRLLTRIVEASSNPGDIVLDCFAGSGTTLVAADSLGRNWLGVDNSPEAIRTMLHRFSFGSEMMGDFVSPLGKKPIEQRTTLFDLRDEPVQLQFVGTSQSPVISSPVISDFDLFAVEHDLETLRSLHPHYTGSTIELSSEHQEARQTGAPRMRSFIAHQPPGTDIQPPPHQPLPPHPK